MITVVDDLTFTLTIERAGDLNFATYNQLFDQVTEYVSRLQDELGRDYVATLEVTDVQEIEVEDG